MVKSMTGFGRATSEEGKRKNIFSRNEECKP